MNPPEETRSERDARRERLAILCALDRAELWLAVRPRPASAGLAGILGGMLSGGGLRNALTIAALLPGAAGRWSRRIADGLRLLTGIGA